MKNTILLGMLILLALIVGACGTSSTPAPAAGADTTYTSPNLDTSYEGALPARNQLALGTLELDGSPNAVTTEQAAKLLPLWQALRGTNMSGGGASAEVAALLEQIEGSMTAEQLTAINALQLTQTDLQEWGKANGVATGTGQPGSGQSMSPEQRATRQAEEGKTPGESGGGISTALLEAVISYLEQ